MNADRCPNPSQSQHAPGARALTCTPCGEHYAAEVVAWKTRAGAQVVQQPRGAEYACHGGPAGTGQYIGWCGS